jgi:uncharacterized OsmC-like protein
MPKAQAHYVSGDVFEVVIGNHRMRVDQPASAGGADTAPAPIELIAASLATCVGFYAERFLRRHALPTDGLSVVCDWDMSEDSPARITRLDVRLDVPHALEPERRVALQRVVSKCSVHNTLSQCPEISIDIVTEGAAA